MLAPSEFNVGTARDASGLSLILPRGRYEHALLFTVAAERLVAITLEGRHPFATFDCTENDAWKGIIIPNVAIELDEQSVFDSEGEYPPLGTLVRKETTLSIIARADNDIYTMVRKPVQTALPPCRGNMAAGFRRWQIVLGERAAKRVLRVVEIEKPKD